MGDAAVERLEERRNLQRRVGRDFGGRKKA